MLATILLAACTSQYIDYPEAEADDLIECYTIDNANQDISFEEECWIDTWWEEYSQRYSLFEGYIGISIARDDFLSEFDYVHEFGEPCHYGGEDIAIWALDAPLTGFEFIKVDDEVCDILYDFYFVPGETLFSLAALQPGHVFVFRNHVGRGIWPAWAVSFYDTNEQRRYVGFVSDLSGERAPYLFAEFARNDGNPPWSVPPWNLCECGMTFPIIVQTPPINMQDSDVNAEFLDDFETVHTYTYIQWDTEWYSTLAFWPDAPVRDFKFVSLNFDAGDERMYFYTREVLLTVDELLPTDVVVLNVAFFHYLIPRGGIVFTDDSGEQRRMLITDVSMRGGCEVCFRSFVLSFHDESHFADWID